MARSLKLQQNRFIGQQTTVRAFIGLPPNSMRLINKILRQVYPRKRGRLPEPTSAFALTLITTACAKTTNNTALRDKILDILTSNPLFPELQKYGAMFITNGLFTTTERALLLRLSQSDENLISEYCDNGTLIVACREIQRYQEQNAYPLHYYSREDIMSIKAATVNTFTVAAKLDTSSHNTTVDCASNSNLLRTPESTRFLRNNVVTTTVTPRYVMITRPLDPNDETGTQIRVSLERPLPPNSQYVGNFIVTDTNSSTETACIDERTNLIGTFVIDRIQEDQVITWFVTRRIWDICTYVFPSHNLSMNQSTCQWYFFGILVNAGQYLSMAFIVKSEQVNNEILEHEHELISLSLVQDVIVVPSQPTGTPEQTTTLQRQNVVSENISAKAAGLYTKPERKPERPSQSIPEENTTTVEHYNRGTYTRPGPRRRTTPKRDTSTSALGNSQQLSHIVGSVLNHLYSSGFLRNIS